MVDYTTVVQMDTRGRLVVPHPVRKSLGVENQSATLEINVRVVDDE